MSENLLEKIDEITKLNQEYRRDINERLNLIRGGLTKKTEDVEEAYDRGLQDMWECIYAINASVNKGGLTVDECCAIFGNKYMTDIVERYAYRECINLYKSHMEKKSELAKKAEAEYQTVKRGDVVEVVGGIGDSCTGIFLSDGYHYYSVLLDGDSHVTELTKDVFRLTKTGKHIDLSLD